VAQATKAATATTTIQNYNRVGNAPRRYIGSPATEREPQPMG
jgi:hypothetical protein